MPLLISILLFLCLATPCWSSLGNDASATTPTLQQMSNRLGLASKYARLLIRYPGVYRVYGRELEKAGVPTKEIVPAKLSLWNEAEQVPINVKSSAKKGFAPDDYIEFVGDYPRGTFSTFKPYNLHNVYLLNWAEADPLRYKERSIPYGPGVEENSTFMERRHYEKDLIMRQLQIAPGITDSFFWLVYQAGTLECFKVLIDFPGFDPDAGFPVRLAFRLFGLTNVTSLKPQHQFDIYYGDYSLGAFGFNGMGYYTFETSVPISRVGAQQRVALRTPQSRESAVDEVALDWIEATYPRRVDALKRDLFKFDNDILKPQRPIDVLVRNVAPSARVFAPEQATLYVPDKKTPDRLCVEVRDEPTTFMTVSDEGLYSVDSITPETLVDPSASIAPDSDVLVLYHPSLRKAAEAYVQYRQNDGLKCSAFDVVKAYDMLDNGFVSDVAVKRFIRYCATRAPKLKYLILLGDSTADYRESRNIDDENRPEVRIPIHWIENLATTWTGGYADDNWYGSFYGLNTPDIAIGRIPANTEEEAFEYLRKVIEYERFEKARDDKALLISSVEQSFQDLARETQAKIGSRFTTTTLLFPETTEAAREVSRLSDEISSGIQLLYYIGHGGAMVWRVGPVDFSKQKDLFTPKDIAGLTNRLHYPIIIASSCYTTSFDYTLSLGEAFLLKPQGGAIAIIGTPWKSTVYEDHAFNVKFLENYVNPANTRLGEAFLKAKRAMAPVGRDVADFQTFTLLGDPCLRLTRKK